MCHHQISNRYVGGILVPRISPYHDQCHVALHHMAGSRGTLRQVLEGPTVHCRDIDAVLESIRRIKSAGSHKLQVKSLFCGENVIFG